MTSTIYNQKWNDFVRECEAETLKENMILDAAKNAVDTVRNAYKYYEEKSTEVVSKVLGMGIRKLQGFVEKLREYDIIDEKCDFKLRYIIQFFKNKKYIKIWASVVKYITEELIEGGIMSLIKYLNTLPAVGKAAAAGKAAVGKAADSVKKALNIREIVEEIPAAIEVIIEKVTWFFENVGDILMELYEAREVWDLAFKNKEDFLEFLQVIKVTDQNFDDMGYSCTTKNTLETETA